MKPQEIRQKFLDFFKSKRHQIVESDALIPQKDPTLLFTTAGMVQFKALYAGAPLSFDTATSVQKCFRAGGKGSDLENVGKTLRHHTFFEMLGNFSFGDYFKEDAIRYALEFIREHLRMDTSKLWVSVYEEDLETSDIWVKNGFDRQRIVVLGKEDNFWGPAGDEGACGPCSEIYYDLGPDYSCGEASCAVGCDCERYLEFWNLVFPQFNQQKDGSRKPLERRGVDTGMGLERLSFLMDQEARNNYETGLFKPIIEQIKSISELPYEGDNISSYHVVADHIRALTFCLAEGILPSNEGRGYVIRRILRRGVRFGQKLGIKKPFLNQLTATVVEMFKMFYPNLSSSKSMVEKVLLDEEQRFLQTLSRGQSHLDQLIKSYQTRNENTVSGEDGFRLYDTYGLPLEVIQEVLEESNLALDEKAFKEQMEIQVNRGKKSWQGTSFQLDEVEAYALEKASETEFLGYDFLNGQSQITMFYQNVEEGEFNNQAVLAVEKTPFYAESGGQIGDSGIVFNQTGFKAVVTDVQKTKDGVFLHSIKIETGQVKEGDSVTLQVDGKRRREIRKHHSATHILQYVLRDILGDHVKQAGSQVYPDKLRFDFSHPKKVSEEELSQVEQKVNLLILENSSVAINTMSIEEAKKRDDILANFGEKYGDSVRMIEIGQSKELCGGTHVDRSGDIGGFKIIAESSVSAGIRRIEAVCGEALLQDLSQKDKMIKVLSRFFKTKPEELLSKVEAQALKIKNLEKNIKDLLAKGSQSGGAKFDLSQRINGVELVIQGFENLGNKELLSLLDTFKSKHPKAVFVLAGLSDGKVQFVLSSQGTENVHCGNILKEINIITGGKGGGSPQMARGGGGNSLELEASLKKSLEILQESL